MTERTDALVVGGGFFGASVALMLAERGLRVALLEREPELLARASYVNQARVHGGYHYPRSILTGLRSRANLPVFRRDFSDCVVGDLSHYYAVARKLSSVTARQFELFCRRIGAPLDPAPAAVRRLFEPSLVEQVYLADEPAFDALRLRDRLRERLAAARVDVRCGWWALSVREAAGGLAVRARDRGGGEVDFPAARVFNCTYSAINHLLARSGVEPVSLRLELTEMAVVDPPPALAGAAVTVMCGPFFSLMPFPPLGRFTLSHVRYTPHFSWEERPGSPAPAAVLDHPHAARPPGGFIPLGGASPRPSNGDRMIRDARRYLPCLADCRQVGSLWEVKTVLPQCEANDARPILFKPHPVPGLFSIMGGKIDNVYDLPRELDAVAGGPPRLGTTAGRPEAR